MFHWLSMQPEHRQRQALTSLRSHQTWIHPPRMRLLIVLRLYQPSWWSHWCRIKVYCRLNCRQSLSAAICLSRFCHMGNHRSEYLRHRSYKPFWWTKIWTLCSRVRNCANQTRICTLCPRVGRRACQCASQTRRRWWYYLSTLLLVHCRQSTQDSSSRSHSTTAA